MRLPLFDRNRWYYIFLYLLNTYSASTQLVQFLKVIECIQVYHILYNLLFRSAILQATQPAAICSLTTICSLFVLKVIECIQVYHILYNLLFRSAISQATQPAAICSLTTICSLFVKAVTHSLPTQ